MSMMQDAQGDFMLIDSRPDGRASRLTASPPKRAYAGRFRDGYACGYAFR